MKSFIIFLSFIIVLSCSNVFAQQNDSYLNQKELITNYLNQKGEIYFKFTVFSKNEINNFSRIISIDNVKGNDVYAYANENELNEFIKFNYKFEVLRLPGEVENVRMSNTVDEAMEWDSYPTYETYVNMMYQFETLYPGLCKIVDAGTTIQGRKILFAKISDSINVREAEPQVQFSSSIHGDETTGYVLMLRLINYLLTNYGTDSRITNLVNNVEIWINPDANPDGTYRGGNSSVSGAVRYNFNNFDLNRNFPDPAAGPTPGGTRQIETTHFMNLFSANKFVLSVNFHGGEEVVNYPWDTWARLNADDNWWIFVSRQYADTVHANAVAGYMTFMNNGITNGYAWYRITGGRQDYMTYFQRGREFTVEISNTKLLPAAQLPAHWNYNYKSFLNYIQKSLYGVRGIIQDSATGLPLKAKVTINGYDMDSSEVTSDSARGNYHRFLMTGTYNMTFSAPNYISKTIPVYTKTDSTTILNVMLRPITSGIISNETPVTFNVFQNYPNPFNPSTTIKYQLPKNDVVKIAIYDVTGKEVAVLLNGFKNAGNYEINWNAKNVSSGLYICKFEALNSGYMNTIKLSLIK